VFLGLRRERNLDGGIEKVGESPVALELKRRSRRILTGAFLSALLLTSAVWAKLH
jgi:hypothetical protein